MIRYLVAPYFIHFEQKTRNNTMYSSALVNDTITTCLFKRAMLFPKFTNDFVQNTKLR